MKLFLLGSTGFIGRRFVAMHARRFQIATELNGRSEEFVDLTPYDAVVASLDRIRPDAILNLAGKSYHSARDEADIYESNALVQMNLHEALAELRLAPKVLLASSSAVYRPSAAPLEEDSPCVPVNTYARAKYLQERIGLSYHPGQRVVIARLFNVIGPRQSTAYFIPAVVERFVRYRRGEIASVPVKTLNATRDFIHVDDVCSALGTLVEAGAPGEIYNVSSGRGIPLTEVTDALREILHLPDAPLDVQEDFVREGIGHQTGSNRKLRALGWSPTRTVRQSLEEIVREEYGI